MPPNATNPAALGARTGLGNGHLLAGDDTPRDSLATAQKQALSPVDSAKLDLLRDFIAERLGYVLIQAEVAQTFAEIGDDAGMTYALKAAVAHMRAAAQSANDIQAIRQGGAA